MTTQIVPEVALLIAPALPLAHSANTDAAGHWAARLSALNALRDARVAAGEAVEIAADYAIAFLDAELERQAAEAAELAQARKLAASLGRADAKAAWHLAGGLDIRRRADGAYLVPSGTRTNVIHVVSADGDTCSCEASGHCWHLSAVAQAEEHARLERLAARKVVFPVRALSLKPAA